MCENILQGEQLWRQGPKKTDGEEKWVSWRVKIPNKMEEMIRF
jgi:hypothetical protein